MRTLSKLLSSRGFSIPEALVGAGLLGLTAVGVVKLSENLNKAQVTVETKMEHMEVKRLIVNTLMDKMSCTKTLNGIKIGDPLTKIVSSVGMPLVETGKTYGSKSTVVSMTTTNKGVLSGDNIIVEVQVNLAAANKTSNSKTALVSVPVNVTANASGIVACYADNDQFMKNSCESLGGSWVGKKCSLPTCAGSQIMVGIDPNGTAICKSPSCPSGQFFQGLDSSGNAICVFANANKSCPSGQQFKGFDAAGNAVCAFPFAENLCPPGQGISGFDLKGKPKCAALPEKPAPAPAPSPSPSPLTPGPSPSPSPSCTPTGEACNGYTEFIAQGGPGGYTASTACVDKHANFLGTDGQNFRCGAYYCAEMDSCGACKMTSDYQETPCGSAPSTPNPTPAPTPSPAAQPDCPTFGVGNWNEAGKSDVCNGNGAMMPAGSVGQTFNAVDDTPPITGTITMRCNEAGYWTSIPSTALCSTAQAAPTKCNAGTVSWGTAGCSASIVEKNNGQTADVRDSETVGHTAGVATFLCENGAWKEQAGAFCGKGCRTEEQVWTVNGLTCQSAEPGFFFVSGATISPQTFATSNEGFSMAKCTENGWSYHPSATCTKTCPSTNITWYVYDPAISNDAACGTYSAKNGPGGNEILTDNTNPSKGSAEIVCQADGTWQIKQAAATCKYFGNN